MLQASPAPEPTFADGEAITPERLLARAKHLTPMPAVVIKLLDVMSDPRCSAARVTRVIERDQAVAAAVIRVANSAMYRGRQPISTLQLAVSRIGMQGLRDITIAASVLRTPTGALGLVKRIRQRMFATGCYARVIGDEIARVSADTCFMTGMLLDVGRFLIGLAEPDTYGQLLLGLPTDAQTIAKAERAWLGFSHAEVGDALAVGWGFPESVCKLIRWQNDWEGAQEQLTPEESWYLGACILADDLVAAREVGTIMTAAEVRHHPTASALRMSDSAIDGLPERCELAVAELGSVFDL